MEKSLLKKYDIPIHHLDFEYIKTCGNAREMEKIVKILRSGEEGFFPDLTRCAEEKLKQLKPDSKLFRFEEQIKHSSVLDKNELKPIYVRISCTVHNFIISNNNIIAALRIGRTI